MTAAEWDRLASTYAEKSGLFPAEETLRRRLDERLPTLRMLDLGIGAGRTTEIFAGRVASYVGLDYSSEMIRAATERLGQATPAVLDVADARDLARWHGHAFELVLFSFNGIDYVDLEGRERVLREVRRVIADDGIFAFSTHSLNALPLSARPTRPSLRDPLRSTARSLRRSVRFILLNRRLDLEAARARGWARIRDGAHDFAISLTMYVEPGFQLRQLQAAGFHADEVLDSSGAPVDDLRPGRDAHLFYICRPVRG